MTGDAKNQTGPYRTTMTLRFVNQQGRELDRVVFTRTAGACLSA